MRKPSSTSITLIANPSAGAGKPNRRRIIALAARELRRHGHRVRVHVTNSPAEVREQAAKSVLAKTSIIMAAGGDGTINAVVNGMMDASQGNYCETALGILPLGTGNVFAYNMGIPEDWRGACQLISGNHRHRIDMGRAYLLSEDENKSRYFLLMAGIGFDAKVMEDTSLRLKYMLRDFAYVLKSLQNAVTYRSSHITVTIDEKPVYAGAAWLAMVGNAASYAWNIRFTAKAQLDDGILDVCLMPYATRLASVQQVMQLLVGQHVDRGTAKYWQAHSIKIASEPPVPMQLDGDQWGTTPVRLEVCPEVLDVMVSSRK